MKKGGVYFYIGNSCEHPGILGAGSVSSASGPSGLRASPGGGAGGAAAYTSATAARELIFLNEHPIEKLPKLR